MVGHADITQKIGTAIYFADLHSPLPVRVEREQQRTVAAVSAKDHESLRLQLEELDEIADSLNTRLPDTRLANPTESLRRGLTKSVGSPSTLQ